MDRLIFHYIKLLAKSLDLASISLRYLREQFRSKDYTSDVDNIWADEIMLIHDTLDTLHQKTITSLPLDDQLSAKMLSCCVGTPAFAGCKLRF